MKNPLALMIAAALAIASPGAALAESIDFGLSAPVPKHHATKKKPSKKKKGANGKHTKAATKVPTASTESLLGRAIRNPNDPLVWAEYAYKLHDEGKFAEAAKAYNNVLYITPNDSDIINKLGVAYHSAELKGAAEVQWKKCLEIDPTHYHCLLNLAGMYGLEQARKEEAVPLLQRFIETYPGSDQITAAQGLLDSITIKDKSAEASEAKEIVESADDEMAN